MEVSYFPEGGSITDYVCEIFGTKVGVSVTRAMKFWGGEFTVEDAEHLLRKKLKGKNVEILLLFSLKHIYSNSLDFFFAGVLNWSV